MAAARVVTFHDIESQHHCLVFLMPPSGIIQLSGSLNKPFTAIAHRFFVRLTPLNIIQMIIPKKLKIEFKHN